MKRKVDRPVTVYAHCQKCTSTKIDNNHYRCFALSCACPWHRGSILTRLLVEGEDKQSNASKSPQSDARSASTNRP